MNWINIVHDLPPPRERVLTATDTGYIEIANFEGGEWRNEESILCENVCFWMPLPTPPPTS